MPETAENPLKVTAQPGQTQTLLVCRQTQGPALWLRLDVTGPMTEAEEAQIQRELRACARRSRGL